MIMKTVLHAVRAALLVGAPIVALAFWAGCNKAEPVTPVAEAIAEPEGEAKLNGDPFIRVVAGGPVVEFRICNTGKQLKSNTLGRVPYICPTACGATFVAAVTGYGGNFCFQENVQYRIRALTGPVNRQMLHVRFPVGYNECTLNPATRFDYNATTGIWSLGTAANGVIWSANITECAP